MKRYSLIAGVLIVVTSIITIASAWHDSPIVDEIPHIGAGYSYVSGHTYQFNPEHPPLAKDFAGLALLALKINPNFLSSYNISHQGIVNDQWNFGRQLIYHSGVDPATIVHTAKLPLILFFILSGWLIYAWGKRTYNHRTALLAVFLFAFSPTIIAHSRFVTTDVPALFGILFATYFFLRYLREHNTLNFWLASVAFGVALLTKFSTFLLIPYFLLLALVWVWIQNNEYIKPTFRLLTRTALVMVVGFVVIVGPIYQLQIFNYPPTQQKNDTEIILRNYPVPTLSKAVIWASDKPVLRSYAQWGLGMAMVFQRAEGGNNTYFLGQFSNKSFKAYFPVVYILKEPIPFLILLLSAIWLGWRAWRNNREPFKNKLRDRFPVFAMLLWIFIYVATSINANLNIGVRHLIPIYGFIFILTAGQIEELFQKIKTTGRKSIALISLLFVLFLWYLVEFISFYPNYLTYFNQFALFRPSWVSEEQKNWPRGGYNYVVDSNLDWGQDLWRLDDFVRQNNIQKIYLDYFGWAEQSFYLGNSFVWMQPNQFASAEQFLKENPTGGWIGVSATFYQESTINHSRSYSWLKNIKPTAIVGNSIFVWHITQP
ncbi:MAG: glycosyltransferase family 39 protein [bacterium]|nr:glycosyltransferase family 39 protein [bacterium]